MTLAQLQQHPSGLEQDGTSLQLLQRAEALLAKAPLDRGQINRALTLLRLAIQGDPANGHAHYLLGFCLAASGQWLGALAAQQRSCQLDSQCAEAWYERGRAALELDQLSEAAVALQKAVVLRPEWNEAWALGQCALVRLAQQQGDDRTSSRLIREALRANVVPSWLAVEWCQLAGAALFAGQLPRARQLFKALAEPPGLPQACSHPLPGRLALALVVIVQLLESEPNPAGGEAPMASLRHCLWLPQDPDEQKLWVSLLEPALQLLLARPVGDCCQADLVRSLRAALPALAPQGFAIESLSLALAQRWPDAQLEAFEDHHQRLQAARTDLGQTINLLPMALHTGAERLRRNPGDGCVRARLDRHLQTLAQLMLDQPNRLVQLPGQTAAALALRQQALDTLVAAEANLAQLDGQSALTSREGPRRHWLLLATDDLPQCWLYRVEQKRQQLEALGCQVRILLQEDLKSGSYGAQLLWADAVVVCRLHATHVLLRAMAAARRMGCLLLYDIDDLLFDPEHCPPAFAEYAGSLPPAIHRSFALEVPLFRAAIEQADGLIVSTKTLARRWQELHPESLLPVSILPNLAPPALLHLDVEVGNRAEGEPLRLVVTSGSGAHQLAWLEELAPAVAEVLTANPSVVLELLGLVQFPELLAPFAARIHCKPFTSYGPYLRRLARADIALVVLEPGPFTDAKSANRWMECSYLGLASVLSPSASYTEILEHGCHTLFARGRDQWVRAVQQLIDQPDLRQAISQQAQQRAQELFAPHHAEAFWWPLIHPQATAAIVPKRRTKLLIITTLFAPQSLDEASQVVQDQVSALLEQAGDRYEVTVLCVDHSPRQLDGSSEAPAIPLDGHRWQGARVVRLALPAKPSDHHHDPNVALFCRRWFVDEGFDLIHAHCLQRLSAAPLQVAAELGIPYVVSLHDAWWLSPRQFLTTEDGRPIDPSDPLAHLGDASAQPEAVLETARQRRRDLEQVLASAQARLAGSEPFAHIYRQAGIADVAVLSNAWAPRGEPSTRAPRDRNRPLRLCYLGGLCLHQGYAVLHAALARHPLPQPGAVLTVIDEALQAQQGYELAWQGTPVSVVAPGPITDKAAFYADQDVLVAPSIWPESHGLVIREALRAGLWVVASDIGAFAELVRHGESGHLVPPGNAEALSHVLRAICTDHPTRTPLVPRQDMDERGIDQLLALYDNSLA